MALMQTKILVGGIHVSLKTATEVLDFQYLIRGMVTTTLHLIDIHKLETLTGRSAHSHRNVYRSTKPVQSNSDLNRVAAMDSIALRHISICENFKQGKESFGTEAFAVYNPFVPEFLQDRNLFAHRWQIWVGEKSAIRKKKGVFPTIAKDYRVALENLDQSIKDVKRALKRALTEASGEKSGIIKGHVPVSDPSHELACQVAVRRS